MNKAVSYNLYLLEESDARGMILLLSFQTDWSKGLIERVCGYVNGQACEMTAEYLEWYHRYMTEWMLPDRERWMIVSESSYHWTLTDHIKQYQEKSKLRSKVSMIPFVQIERPVYFSFLLDLIRPIEDVLRSRVKRKTPEEREVRTARQKFQKLSIE